MALLVRRRILHHQTLISRGFLAPEPGFRSRESDPRVCAGSLSRRCPSEGPPGRSAICSGSQASIPPQQPLVRRRRQTPPAMASFIDLASAAFLYPLSSTSTHQFRNAMQSALQAIPRRADLSFAEDIARGRSGLAVGQGGRCRTDLRAIKMSVFGKRPGRASFSAPRGSSLVVYWHVVEMSSLLTYMHGASGVLLPLRSARSPLEVFDLLLGRVLQARPFSCAPEAMKRLIGGGCEHGDMACRQDPQRSDGGRRCRRGVRGEPGRVAVTSWEAGESFRPLVTEHSACPATEPTFMHV